MLIRSKTSLKKATSKDTLQADISSEFSAPKEYNDGSRKLIRDSYTGDWWLNVDYVVVEKVAEKSAA